MARLKRRLDLPPSNSAVWRRGVGAVAVLAVAGAAWLAYRSHTPPPPGAATVAGVAAQVYLHDAEVAARLAVLRGWLQDRRDEGDLVTLYTATVDLLRARHEGLERFGLQPTWAELQPTAERLGIQLANGDPAAAATVDELLAALGAGFP